jgi:hypothetical protein
MQGLVGRLTQNADGTWALPSYTTKDEMKLANCVSTVMVVRPAFDGRVLTEDFMTTLKSNGLTTKEEIREL